MTPDADADALAAMRSRVDDAYAAADRLVRQAEQAARAAAAGVPPAGWSGPPEAAAPDPLAELRPLLRMLDGARAAIPPELAERIAIAARELLLALRALLDWWIERMEHRPEPPTEVEDIPID